MSRGMIYFIQPCELVGTNRYKIGCSKIPDLKRCNYGYRKGSRYICIMECNNPLGLEKNIKDEFNKLFTLIAGDEYFEGDETIMKRVFLKIIEEYDKLDENLYNKLQEKIKRLHIKKPKDMSNIEKCELDL